MYFKLPTKELLAPLKMIAGVAEQRAVIPILANALVRVENNTLHFIATDAEVEVACSLPLEAGIGNEGETTIPARKIHDICKLLSNSNVQLNTEDNIAVIKAGKSKFKLQTLPPEDFPNSPKLSEPTELLIPQRQLKHLFSKASFCIATNDVRYFLNGLLLEIGEGKMSFVGTDGHRMAVSQHDFTSEQATRVIIPRKAIMELAKILTDSEEQIKITMDSNHIRFKLSDSLAMTSKLISGDFPNWQGIIPPNPDKIVMVEAAALKQSLTRASILSNEKFKGVRLVLSPNLLAINASNSLHEAAEEILEVEYDGEELEIGFNGTYLIDALNAVTTKMAKISLSDANTSCLITDDDSDNDMFIVMPMRI